MFKQSIGFLIALLSVLTAHVGFARGQEGDAGESNPALWEVTSGTSTVYLLGTIHIGSREMYPLPAAVEAAYSRSGAIALEADPGDPNAMVDAMSYLTYQGADTLEGNLPAPLFRDVMRWLESSGLPGEMAQKMKPQMLAMTMTMFEAARQGLDANLGTDIYLARRARNDGKRIIELESMRTQLTMLDELPRDVQVAMLENTLASVKSGQLAKDLSAMVQAWRKGDMENLDAVAMRDMQRLPKSAGQTLRTKLFDERNISMTEKIIHLLKGNEITLVGVGAGHMTGPKGIVELLRARGFKVRRA